MFRRAPAFLLLAIALVPRAAEARKSPLEGYAIACGWDRRAQRFEIAPAVGVTVGDPLVRHYQGNLGLRYWINNEVAIGSDVQIYRAEPLAAMDEIAAQYRRSVDARRFDYGWNAAVSYAAGDGKLAFLDEIWGVDLELTALAGVTHIETLGSPPAGARVPGDAVGDDALAFTAGAGLSARMFVCDSTAISLGARVMAVHDPATDAWMPSLVFQLGVSSYLGRMHMRCRVVGPD